MIIAIPILDPRSCTPVVDEMLKLRAKVFKEILNWDVTVNEKGHEIDQFDQLPGTYLVSVDENMQAQASLRLLPTTGPYMASDVFAQLLNKSAPPRSPIIWESSRFFARPAVEAGDSTANRYWATQAHNKHIAELICGLACYSSQIGLDQIVSVFDVAVERFLRSMGVRCSRLGDPQNIGKSRAVAGMFSTSVSQIEPLAEKWGFDLDTLVVNAANVTAPLQSNWDESAQAAVGLS